MFRFLIAAISLSGVAGVANARVSERDLVLAEHVGDTSEDVEIRRWQWRVAQNASPVEAYERLGWAFVAKGRRTLDDGFYTLAEATADMMAKDVGLTAGARLMRGHARQMLHRFREAEQEARMLVEERGAPEDFALLSDALMEQGDLDGAVEALQHALDLRPDAGVLCRVSHVRWLSGDEAGAVAAMREALQATEVRRGEKRAWMLVRWSALALQRGDVDGAKVAAEHADALVPDFAPALLARGRVDAARSRWADAAALLKRAVETTRLPEHQWWLADVLRAAGETAEAEKVEDEIVRRGAATDPRTFALYLATRGMETNMAVRLARAELELRQDVFTYDALAWALAQDGQIGAARDAMRAALAECTKDARLFLHAREIAWRHGDVKEAAIYDREARKHAAALTPSERAILENGAGRLDGATEHACAAKTVFRQEQDTQ